MLPDESQGRDSSWHKTKFLERIYLLIFRFAKQGAIAVDKQYFLPLSFGMGVFMTSRELLEENGIEPEALGTWDGFCRACRKYRENNPGGRLFNVGCDLNLYYLSDLFHSSGFRMIDYEKNEVSFDEARFREMVDLCRLYCTPTVPEDLVRSFDSPELYEEWTRRSELLHQNLASSRLTECIALPEDESLFQGSAPVEAVPGTEGLCYTPEQYAMHIRNILRLSGQYPSYRFYILPEVPFRNIRLLISEEAVTVVRSVAPYLSMSFTHPLMCRAFRSYADHIKDQYKEDRDSVRRHLENRYL